LFPCARWIGTFSHEHKIVVAERVAVQKLGCVEHKAGGFSARQTSRGRNLLNSTKHLHDIFEEDVFGLSRSIITSLGGRSSFIDFDEVTELRWQHPCEAAWPALYRKFRSQDVSFTETNHSSSRHSVVRGFPRIETQHHHFACLNVLFLAHGGFSGLGNFHTHKCRYHCG
jgi:hypothetical protein